MNSEHKKTSAPLEAYYSAPKASFEELLDISDWGLIDKIVFIVQLPLSVVYITLMVLDLFGVKLNRLVDGVIVICAWSIFLLYVWMYQKKTAPDGKPSPKRFNFWMVICWTVISIAHTFFWLINYL